jgi:hypothetical protein
LLTANANAASAQEKAMASQLFDDADKLMGQKQFGDACPKYAESNRLDPQLGTLLHLAECYERSGKTASAWASFKDGAEIAAQRGDPREPKIRERLADIEKRLPKLIITVPPTAPSDLEVQQDGNVVGRAVWGSPVPVDPGTHTITASAAGRQSWTQAIQIGSSGGAVQLAIPELAAAQAGAAPVPAPPPEQTAPPPEPASNAAPPGPDKPSNGNTQRTLGFVAGGAGVVGLVVGTVFMVQRGSKLSDRDGICPSGVGCAPGSQNKINSLTDDARSAQTIGTIGLIAGGALVAGGLALVFTAPKGEGGSVAIAPVTAPGFQGLTVSGTL